MESKEHFFGQTEETVDSSDNEASNLPPKSNESKKYSKISKTIEKRTSLRTVDLSPDHKRGYETSLFLSREENSSDSSAGKTVRKKKSLQVYLHSKRTEIASPPLKPSKEITRKESTPCKLPDQLGAPKPSISPRKYSSSIRRKESLSNLYMTLYEEVPEGNISKEDLNATHKACKIFGKVRGGKIYVNDLPVVLSMLKIPMTDSEIRWALKMIDIDVNGMLEFSNFLKTVNNVSSLVSQDPAFLNALKIFSKMKGGRVSTDEVGTILDSLDIPINPETIQQVLKYSFIDRNQMVDIGDIVFSLGELQQLYEDVSTLEDPGLNEKGSNRTLSYVAPYRRKSSSARSSESSLLKRLEKKIFQSYSNVLERNDSEYKEPKVSSQKFPDVVDSRHTGIQEPYSKYGTDLRKLSEKVEIPDSKSKPQSLRSITSLNKFLDKSDITSIPKPQKPSGKRRSTLLKQISSKEEPAVNTLENILQAISKLQENYITVEDLQSTLPLLGITLSDTEFQRSVKETKNENGLVNLDDFIMTLSKDQSFHEYDVLTNVINAFDKIEDEKVDCEDLNTCLEDFGIYLSKPEVEKLVELTEADETEKVNFKQFIDTLMNNTDFSEKLKLPGVTENLQNLSQEQMNIYDLWDTLSSLNSNLKKEKFLDAVKLAKVDDDKVQLKEFEKIVKNMHDASRLKELQEIAVALDSLEGDMIAEKNLEDFLKNVGIKSPKEEAEKILQSDFVSEGNTVNVNDCLKSLKDTPKFSNFIALNELLDTLDHMEDSYPSDKDKYSDVVEKSYFTDDTLQEILNVMEDFRNEALSSNLQLPAVDEIKEAANIFSHVDDKKIDIPKLEHALKCLNLNLREEDFNETLKHCDTNDNKEVDLQDFLTEMKESPNFKNSTAMELLLATTQVLQDDLVDVSDLKTLLENAGLGTANVVLTEMLRNVPEYEHGKVTIHEILTKLADALTIPKASEAKIKFYNVNIQKSDPKAVSDIQQNLSAVGIHLTDEETQKVLDNTNPSDEVVSFKDVIRELANTDDFMECQRIEDMWNIVNTVSDGKVEVKELLSTLKNLEKPLNEDHLEVLLSSATDENKFILKDVIDSFTDSSKPSPFNSLLKETTALDNIINNTMPVNELNSKLLSAGIPIDKTFQEILRKASIKENDEISLKQILENLDKSKPAPEFEDVQELSKAFDKVTNGKVDVADVQPVLKGLKVYAPEEELQKMVSSISVDKAKNLLKALASIRKNLAYPDDLFSILENMGVHLSQDVIQNTLKNTTLRKDTIDARDLDSSLGYMGTELTKEQLDELERNLLAEARVETDLIPLTDTREVISEEVEINDLENVIKNMGIELTPRERLKLEKLLPTDVNGKIDKNKLMSLVETIKGSQIDVHDIDSLLGNMTLKLTPTESSDLSSDLLVDEKGEIDTSDMKKNPEFMGIELEDKDHWEMVNDQPVNGQKIDVKNLDSILGGMEIKQIEEEIEKQTENLQTEEKTDFSKLTDAVKVESGEEIDVSGVASILEHFSPELTPRGSKDLMKNVPVDHSEKTYEMRLEDDVQSLQGGMVDVVKLDTNMQNMEMKLIEDEISDCKQNLLVDGKEVDVDDLESIENVVLEHIDQEELKEMKNLPTDGGTVDANEVDTLLQTMGINLSEKEISDLMQNMLFDGKHVEHNLNCSEHQRISAFIIEPLQTLI
ncbi:EF-hand calcium-binding domain-containing protein 13 [Perognathus longimembris pacificus]|uniref:EF-hand calcium-binding domain-containing protein 13 n=1 Tax=Perognathus longimembris pacificus TaxID=214514 RepID=UPI002019E1E5|nr:EF-hand calcium-binding domain-containing protein 13 [Perognathus longimembris pacificus]